MLGIFHKEATSVGFHSSSRKVKFCFTKGARKFKIITNRDFPKVVFKKKTVILDSYIKEDISSG